MHQIGGYLLAHYIRLIHRCIAFSNAITQFLERYATSTGLRMRGAKTNQFY